MYCGNNIYLNPINIRNALKGVRHLLTIQNIPTLIRKYSRDLTEDRYLSRKIQQILGGMFFPCITKKRKRGDYSGAQEVDILFSEDGAPHERRKNENYSIV